MQPISTYALQGFQLVQSGRAQEGVAKFQEGLKADPNDGGCLLGLARLRLLAGDRDGAVPFLRRLSAAHPELPEAQSHLALMKFQDGDERALETLRTCATAPGAGVFDFLNLGKALSLKHDAQGAEAAFSRAASLEPHNPFPLLEAAEAALARRDSGAAIVRLEAAVRLAPDEVALLCTLADAYEMGGQPKRASEAIGRAGALDPDDPELLSRRYELASAAGDWKEARAAASRLVQQKPDGVQGRYMLGRALAYEGRLPEARELLEKLVAEAPEAAEPRQVLADLLGQLGDRARARALLLEAVELSPAAIGPANDLANAYFEDGAWADAERVLGPVAKAHPDDPITNFNLALATSKRDAGAAIALARKVEASGHPSLAPEARRLIAALSRS